MDRPQRRPRARPAAPAPLRALLCFALLGLCTAGHRPYREGERGPRHPGEHDLQQDERDGAQRVHFPSLSDQGAGRVQHPWAQDRGQVVRYPTLEDSAADAGIKVKQCVCPSGPYSVARTQIGQENGCLFVCLRLCFQAYGWIGSVNALIRESKRACVDFAALM